MQTRGTWEAALRNSFDLAMHGLQVLKQKWPQKWPTFVQDLIGVSKNSGALYENSMVILKLLSEEVFNFSGRSPRYTLHSLSCMWSCPAIYK